jgi:hypothetical protein
MPNPLKDVIQEFESILASPSSEEEIHSFVAKNSFLLQVLLPFHPSARLYTKVPLATEFVTDFVGIVPRTVGLTYYLFELELSTVRLFTKAGDPSAALSHAIRQILDWRAWVNDHGEYARSMLPGIFNPLGVIVIGRRDNLSGADRRRLAQFLVDSVRAIDVITYDRILDIIRLKMHRSERTGWESEAVFSFADLRSHYHELQRQHQQARAIYENDKD